MAIGKIRPKSKKQIFCLLQCWFLFLSLAQGEGTAEWRMWKSSTGSQLDAKLISQNAEQVLLEKRDGTQVTVKLAQLAASELTYLGSLGNNTSNAETPKIGPTSITGLDAVAGKTSGEIICKAAPKWSYLIYLPTAFHTGRTWPVCFVMAPGGGGNAGILNRYIPAANHLGIILALSTQSKNEFADSEIAMMAMVKDIYDRAPITKNFSIASGMSGGSRMAYLMAEYEKNVAGVLACGSGAGVYIKEKDFRSSKLRPNTIICSLIGSNDFNRREAVESHKDFNKNSRFIWFVGKHDWAEGAIILDGMSHIYGQILKTSKEPGLDPLRAEFARNQLAWAKTQQKTSPALAQYWAEFLSQFPGNATVQREASTWLAELNKSPDVTLALKAEKAIESFSSKYFSDGNTAGDKKPDEGRAKDASKKAAEFPGLPQAEILKKLGDPV